MPFDDPSDTDLVPELVTLIDVSELGQNLQSVVGSQRLTGKYENGATITISSVSDKQDDLDMNDLPKAFQMSMIGVNANGGTIVFSALIIYTGSCDDYPVLLFGTSNGWALLVSTWNVLILASKALFALTSPHSTLFKRRSKWALMPIFVPQQTVQVRRHQHPPLL